jgi:hypothetical protein
VEQGDFQTVLRAAGETESTQENIQDWLQLHERDPGFQLLTGRSCCSGIFLYISIITTYITFFIYFFSDFFLSFLALGFFNNPDYWLISMTCNPSVNPD